MMTEMLERIAKAIDPWGFDGPADDPEVQRRRTTSLLTARAVLKAIREPAEDAQVTLEQFVRSMDLEVVLSYAREQAATAMNPDIANKAHELMRQRKALLEQGDRGGERE